MRRRRVAAALIEETRSYRPTERQQRDIGSAGGVSSDPRFRSGTRLSDLRRRMRRHRPQPSRPARPSRSRRPDSPKSSLCPARPATQRTPGSPTAPALRSRSACPAERCHRPDWLRATLRMTGWRVRREVCLRCEWHVINTFYRRHVVDAKVRDRIARPRQRTVKGAPTRVAVADPSLPCGAGSPFDASCLRGEDTCCRITSSASGCFSNTRA